MVPRLYVRQGSTSLVPLEIVTTIVGVRHSSRGACLCFQFSQLDCQCFLNYNWFPYYVPLILALFIRHHLRSRFSIPFCNFRIIWSGTLHDDLVNIKGGGLGPFHKAHRDVCCHWPTLIECCDLWDVGSSCFETGYGDCSYQSHSEAEHSRVVHIRRRWTRASTKTSAVEIFGELNDDVGDS